MQNPNVCTSGMGEPEGCRAMLCCICCYWLLGFFFLLLFLEAFHFLISSSFSSSFLNFSLASAMKFCKIKYCQPPLTIICLQALHNSSQPRIRLVHLWSANHAAENSCWHHMPCWGLPALPGLNLKGNAPLMDTGVFDSLAALLTLNPLKL